VQALALTSVRVQVLEGVLMWALKLVQVWESWAQV